MSVISVSNSKGGAGKTTLAMILADQLVENGFSVAVIDADPNGIITKWAAKRAEAGREMPYSVTSEPKEAALIETIAQLANKNDMVIIDLEGTASRMMSRALIRSHLVLVPFNQSPVDAELAAAAVSLIQEEEEAVERKIPFRLVRSRTSAAVASKTSKRITSAIEEAGLPLLPIGVVERAAYRDIYEFGLRLSELDHSQTSGVPKAIENAQDLAQAVVDSLKEDHRG